MSNLTTQATTGEASRHIVELLPAVPTGKGVTAVAKYEALSASGANTLDLVASNASASLRKVGMSVANDVGQRLAAQKMAISRDTTAAFLRVRVCCPTKLQNAMRTMGLENDNGTFKGGRASWLKLRDELAKLPLVSTSGKPTQAGKALREWEALDELAAVLAEEHRQTQALPV